MTSQKRVSILYKLRALLTPRERRRGILVLFMMMLLALVETAGVASVMPFLAVLGSPDIIETNSLLRWLYVQGGFTSRDDFLFFLGVGAFLVVLLSAALRILSTYIVNRYTLMHEYSLSARLLQAYLRQPYTFFLSRNSAELSKTVLDEARQVVTHAIKPAMALFSYGLVACFIIALLVVVDPLVAAIVGVVTGLAYAAIYLLVRRLLLRIGADRVAANMARYQAASEAFGGIKDLKVLGREGAYLRRYKKPAARFARCDYLKATLALTPRYVIEVIAFGGILALSLFLMMRRDNLGSVLPLLGLYAFAGYKLLPAAQHIFASLSDIRFGGAALDAVYGDLQRSPAPSADEGAGSRSEIEADVRFCDVGYKYSERANYALEGLDVAIPAGSSLGFVGATGAGKTTAVDLLLGLLEPSKGEIRVDGIPLREFGLRSWRSMVGYVPQSIYLADGPVSENIAFGLRKDKVDEEAVRRAAETARIHDFITNELPDGYSTIVGERGVRLSGGQRQRIGIARALYHNPSVLVLDEATSALDTATEQRVMEAVEHLHGEKIVIVVAHRLSTVQRCDQIVVLDQGRVAAIGRYEDLETSDPVFRSLAVLAKDAASA